MPEANVLYSVTAAVVLGLVTWVAVVLKTAKEPWARELPKPAHAAGDDVPLETPAENEMTSEGGPAALEDAPDASGAAKRDAASKADAAEVKAPDAKAPEAKAAADAEAADAKAAKADAKT